MVVCWVKSFRSYHRPQQLELLEFMESDSTTSAMSVGSASGKAVKGRRRGRPASKSSAPTQAKLLTLAAKGVPEPIGTKEQPFSSLEEPRASTSSAYVAAGDNTVFPQQLQTAPVAAPRATKVRETWSAVVKCDDPALSGKAIAEKVRTMVAPSLGVRVHEVRELRRGGGAIIRTPSVGELQKVVHSKKFAEHRYWPRGVHEGAPGQQF
ncbi:hypothetical protein KR200_008571 [Drosophila serrata]|nr:hypothetical protein KR200_008571 [Drosophila serrata]